MIRYDRKKENMKSSVTTSRSENESPCSNIILPLRE